MQAKSESDSDLSDLSEEVEYIFKEIRDFMLHGNIQLSSKDNTIIIETIKKHLKSMKSHTQIISEITDLIIMQNVRKQIPVSFSKLNGMKKNTGIVRKPLGLEKES